MQRIIVIGGGAAGYFGAIAAAEANPASQIMILERGAEVLGKVRISGGGRCNLTHNCPNPQDLIKFYPRGSRELLGPFHRFGPTDTIAWFGQRGVATKTESDGRMFPVTDDSGTIVHCLQENALKLGIRVRTQVSVSEIIPPETTDATWTVKSGDDVFSADKLLLTSGSNPRVWDMLAGLGHRIIAPVPSLFTFQIHHPILEGLSGISVPLAQVQIEGRKLQAAGPLLITHKGVSGPAVLRLSAWGARDLAEVNHQFSLKINWLGEKSATQALEMLHAQKRIEAKKAVANACPFDLPNRLWKQLVTSAEIPETTKWADLNKTSLQALHLFVSQTTLPVSGKNTFKEEFVTAGGVDLKEVDFKRFESKIHPGLFFAGEVLNIDAITGGFNFQAAWTGGWIAGQAMAELSPA